MTPSSSTQALDQKIVEVAKIILSVSSVSYDEANNERREMARAAAAKVLAALPTEADNYGGASDGIALADAIRPPATEAVEPVGKLDHTALEAAKAAFRINPMADGALDAAILAYLAALPTEASEPSLDAVKAAIRKGLTDNLVEAVTARRWDADMLLAGCQHYRGDGYTDPVKAADHLATDAAKAVMALYAHPAPVSSAVPVAQGWRYSINYGPDGEEDWANLITPEGQHVANIRTHHAARIVTGLNANPVPSDLKPIAWLHTNGAVVSNEDKDKIVGRFSGLVEGDPSRDFTPLYASPAQDRAAIKPLLDAVAKYPKALNSTRFNQFASLYPEVAAAILALIGGANG